MAHRDQIGSPLGRGDPGDARHFQRVALGVLRQLFEHGGPDLHEGLRCGRALGVLFRGDVHHARAALFIVMRELFHLSRYLSKTRIISPAAHDSRSGSVTRNAFARASEFTSPDPCHGSGATVDPSAETCAGRKRVSPGLCRTSFDRRACSRGSGASCAATQQFYRGAREYFKRHHSGCGISRQAEEEFASGGSEHQRLPGLNQHAVEEEFRAQIGQHTLDDIVLARRYAAREQQQIMRRSLVR